MAETRRVVPSVDIPSVRLRPVAAPSPTPVRPPASDNARALIQSLSGASETLGQLSGALAQQEDSTERQRGEQLAREIFESGKTARDAIRSGQITPAESKWFQLGFNEQYGRLSATRFGSDLQREISAGALKDETSMEKFDQFVQQFQQQWVQANVDDTRQNEAFRVGFSRQIDGVISGARYQFANTAGQSITAQTAEQTYQEAYNVISLGLTNNDPLESVAQRVNQMADGLKAQGMNMSQANTAIAQAVARVARDRKDVRIIDALAAQIRAGSGTLAGVRSEIGDLFEQSRDYILSASHQQGTWETEERERTRVTQSRAVVNSAFAALNEAGNPASVDLDGFKQQLQDLGSYEFVDDLMGVQRALAAGTSVSNPQMVRSLMVRIFQHTEDSDPQYLDSVRLSRVLQNGQISNEDFGTVLGYLAQRDNMYGEGGSAGSSGVYPERTAFNGGLSRLRALFPSEDAMDFSPVVRARADGAQSEYIAMYLEWKNSEEGKNATSIERNKFIKETIQSLYENWQESPEDSSTLPAAQTDANNPVWRTQRVLSKASYNTLLTDLSDGNGISAPNQRFLRMRGVTPDQIQEFLQTQRGLLGIQ